MPAASSATIARATAAGPTFLGAPIMGDITNFKFNTNVIRVVTIEGEPWFAAADVCRAVEMDITKGTERWLRGTDRSERRVVTRDDYPVLFRGDRAPSVTIISESALYRMILRSDKPQAKPFQDWVTKEVLPAIRKDGMYVKGEEKLRTGEMSFEEMQLIVMRGLEDKVRRITAERDEMAARALHESTRANDAETKQDEMRTVFGQAEHSVSRFARPRKIRELIEANEATLERYGILPRRRANSTGRGQTKLSQKHGQWSAASAAINSFNS